MLFRISVLIFAFLLRSHLLVAQQIDFSLPTKISYGTNQFDILGRNSEGIVIQESSRAVSTIEVFSSEMKLKWKKNVNIKELGASVAKIFIAGDSVLVFYSHFVKGECILKVLKMNDRFEAARSAVTLDSIAVFNYYNIPEFFFSVSNDKSKYLIYYAEDNATPKNKIHSILMDGKMNLLRKQIFRTQSAEQPELLSALVNDSAQEWFLVGDNQARNFKNDFPYLTFQLYYFNDSTKKTERTDIYGDGMLMTEPIMKMDWIGRRIIISGLFTDNPGNESKGTCYISYNTENNRVAQKKFLTYPADLLTTLSGNNPPKRNDGFFNFKPQDMIVKKDGGAILLTEAISISTESFSAPGYGGFGVTSSLTVNYFHYDDIMAINFSPDGDSEWQKIFTKKQQTEGDGGYYSSFCTFIGSSALQLVYNDFISGMADFSKYKIAVDGSSDRAEIFNGDRKGILPVCQYGKQISATELLVPSVKRGYLQFIKITF